MAVEAAFQSRDKLRLLYLLGDDVTGFSAGAAWQDVKVGMEHVTQWEQSRIDKASARRNWAGERKAEPKLLASD
jgi:hypothetical protein